MDKHKPSEVLEQFLAYLEEVRTEYEQSFEIVKEEDKRLQDLLHALEFSSNKQERNKVSTQFQKSRKRRRTAKDKVLELEKYMNFKKTRQISHF